MGKINRGILGGVSGKVANIIGGSWKGIAYLRSLPLSVSQPNTAAQVNQRTRFSMLVFVAKLMLLDIVQPLWNRLAVKQSGYNMFIQQNSPNFNQSGVVDPSLFLIADGNATGAPILSMLASSITDECTINWNDNSGSGTALATDKVFIGLYDQANDEWYAFQTSATRADETVILSGLTGLTSPGTLHGYLAFKSANGLKISGTSHGTATIA